MTDEVESDAVDALTLELATTNAGAPQLTRLTWRQGARRKMYKRKQNWAGVTVAPPAFLAAAKLVAFKPGRPGRKTCSATKKDGSGKCNRLALRGMKVCEAHGGQLALAREGRLQKSGRAAAAIAAKEAAKQERLKMPEGRPSDVPPLELTRLRCYIEASERQKIRLAMAFGTDSWQGVVMSLRERDDPPPGDDRKAVLSRPPRDEEGW